MKGKSGGHIDSIFRLLIKKFPAFRLFRNFQGFNLIELMIVVAIVGILAVSAYLYTRDIFKDPALKPLFIPACI